MTATERDTTHTAGRPRMICYMMASSDDRIVTEGWPLSDERAAEYERIHESYAPDAWLCGRVMMERHWAAGARSEPGTAVSRGCNG